LPKKDPKRTPTSKIKAALRQLSLRSRERAYALKRDQYTCTECGAKKSVAKGNEVKVQVHHKRGINWDKIIEFIRKELLCSPDNWETKCKDCHKSEHKKDKNE